MATTTQIKNSDGVTTVSEILSHDNPNAVCAICALPSRGSLRRLEPASHLVKTPVVPHGFFACKAHADARIRAAKGQRNFDELANRKIEKRAKRFGKFTVRPNGDFEW